MDMRADRYLGIKTKTKGENNERKIICKKFS
jgi:hypothetical protein